MHFLFIQFFISRQGRVNTRQILKTTQNRVTSLLVHAMEKVKNLFIFFSKLCFILALFWCVFSFLHVLFEHFLK